MALFEMLGFSFVFVFMIMSFMWLFYAFFRKSSLIDIGRALCFFAIAIIYLILGEGYWLRKFFMMSMVILWAGRLTYFLTFRLIHKHFINHYAVIEKKMVSSSKISGGSLGIFYLIFILQGLLTIVLSLPFIIVSQNLSSHLTSWEAMGAGVWIIALCGEILSDRQLLNFHADPDHKNQVLRTGFWKYSRHPNYFFEWCIWIGYALFAMGSPWGWISWLAPILMLYLLIYVTGIPLNEASALSSKGNAYRDYQRKTSPFIPWF